MIFKQSYKYLWLFAAFPPVVFHAQQLAWNKLVLSQEGRADYVAKHGAPNEAAPEIFFRYYFVNSSTGEKSGTMLAECKWQSSETAKSV